MRNRLIGTTAACALLLVASGCVERYFEIDSNPTGAHLVVNGGLHPEQGEVGTAPLRVAFDHYGKEWGQYYQDPLWAALGENLS